MRVKICGITTLQDALDAIQAGADMLGYNFYAPSQRYISPERCAQIQHQLAQRHPAIVTVGVFVNASREYIQEVMARCNLDYAQLSGDETPAFAARLRCPWFKAVRPAGLTQPERIHAFVQAAASPQGRRAPALLVDAHQRGQYGGTGRLADWQAAATLARRYPILLAGGLNPANVQAAVERVHPWGVDVASGVEIAPGRKDPEKVKRFVARAKQASRKPPTEHPEPKVHK